MLKKFFTVFILSTVWTTLPVIADELYSAENLLRAGKMIDAAVYNKNGDEIAEIEDLIVRRNGKVKKTVLSVGGYLEIGDREVAVLFSQLTITKGKIVYDITRQQLEKHPEIDYEKQGVYQGFFIHPYPYGRPPGHYPRGRRGGPHYSPYREPVEPIWRQEHRPERFLVSVVLDRIVLNYRGESLGNLEDLLIGKDRTVKKIIITVGGVLGVGEKRVAVPFDSFVMTYYGTYYDMSPRELEKLPEFSYSKE